VSPILVRPVREQLEHDRVIRLLQVKLKRRCDIAANIGTQQTVPVKVGPVMIFPDLVLTSTDRSKKIMATVEVETAESVNHLEAMAQWAHMGRAKAPFHLYVPAGSVDIARRLAAENHVNLAELWSFHTIGDQTRFTLVHRSPSAQALEARRAAANASREKAAPKSAPAREKSAPAREKSAPRKNGATAAAPRRAKPPVKRPGALKAKAATKKPSATQKRK
jgi:hypothetical protein